MSPIQHKLLNLPINGYGLVSLDKQGLTYEARRL